MTRLYLVRHGAVETGETFYGQLDVPLSDEGQRQMERAAEALAGIELAAVHCSDLARAVESARIVAGPHRLEPIPDPAFREMHLGALEGLPLAEVRQRHPELANKRYQDMWSFRFPGGGENLQDIAARARPALARIVEAHPDANVVLVAHNSVNRILLGDALGLTLDRVFGFVQDFGCINRIDLAPERARVALLNWRPGPLD
jgi:alpha-ribazole phosphatase